MGKSRHGNESGQPSLRLLRVGENLRHAISTVIQRGDIQPPRCDIRSHQHIDAAIGKPQ